ncbi:MAG TPA: IS4 family transposase [Micromonosporaceae bacterium]|nr:IS4 family transposase [Micromonosporaceae bacterium]
MSVSASASPATEPAEQGSLREVVLAGPGGVPDVGDEAAGGVWALLADARQIAAGLAAAGHMDTRRRALPGVVTVLAVLALCLFRRESYTLVLARVFAAWPQGLAPGEAAPTASALSQARARLAGQPLRELFTATAAGVDHPATAGSYLFGLLVTAFDGTVLDLAATDDNAAEFAVPRGGRFPQARLLTHIACGTRRVLAAQAGSSAVSEQALTDQLLSSLGRGMLNLADRNFFSMARWVAAAGTGAQLAWRVKNGIRSLPARITEALPDGSAHVRLRESDAMLAARRAKAGDRHLPRLADTIARLVEFTVTVTDRQGRKRTSRFRVLTTLLDHVAYPAEQIAAAYAERWQAETTYLRLKVTLRGAGTRLRAHSPHLARQEIWGLLIVYNALVNLAVQAAVDLGVDPDQVSFTAVLALTHRSLGTASPCLRCGHQMTTGELTADLLTEIRAQPLVRTGRHRSSPRTKTQRRTEHTRTVSYTIEIVTSNLPRVE